MTSDPPIRMIRAANPSPLTGTGTNTYLVGTTDIAVIDPGPDLTAHLDAILGTLGPGQRISQILITHAHLDHTALVPRLISATGAAVFAFGTALEGRSPLMTRLAPALADNGEGLDLTFSPDPRLVDGAVVSGPDWSLTALHTPGHLGGHLCFAMGDTLFSGDHVMGWSTSIISPPDGDMAAYMASLDRLTGHGWQRFLPGHGNPVDNPGARLQELASHRHQREAQILQALSHGPARIREMTARVYAGLALNLFPAAERNVLAHLIDLETRNLVTAFPGLTLDAEFSSL